jgi:hypothetical protein
MSLNDYTVGQRCWVYSIGVWYAGIVRKVTPKRLVVDFTTGRGKRHWTTYSRTDRRVTLVEPVVLGKKVPFSESQVPL